ncbi:MAG: ABC transporter ATP-binding protein [Minisyncoccia bacterium]
MKNSEQKSQVAISVKNICKRFTIPHEKTNTLKGAFVNLFKKKNYEIFNALEDVSFEIKKGEFFGIIGRNGSGKSTLLKILAGVYTADKGHTKINGLISPFLELGIGFNPELSGRDNIYLNATVLGLTQKEIDEKYDSIVAFSELERFIDQKIKNYSSGMMVRLAFSVAIHANREILLMDEVLAVGDSNFQSKCLREFARYKEMGKTVILVTHDTGTIQRYCDRAMLLRNGKIAMIGNAEEVGNEYIYQNMSDEEKRVLKEQAQAKIKAEKDRIKNEKRLKEEQKHQEEERIKAEKEAEKLKGKAREEEMKRLEDGKKRQEEERKRKEEEEIKRKEEELKNRVAEITNVEFLDKDGKSKNVFETGESMDIKIHYVVYKKNISLNIGLGIHSESNGQLLGYTTQADKYHINHNSNSVTLSFDKLTLLKGEYFINVSCFRNIGETCYDFKPKYRFLKVFSTDVKNNYAGIFCIEHKWL